jgi:hypothetical protein
MQLNPSVQQSVTPPRYCGNAVELQYSVPKNGLQPKNKLLGIINIFVFITVQLNLQRNILLYHKEKLINIFP